ncbi:hypothetical protein XM50_11720 [Sphingomonas sp. Ag1]|nr:hypothetical protein XM50_11720 [Sphingomonas sp. Ag1]
MNKGHVRHENQPHTHLNLLGEPPGTKGPRCLTGTLRPMHQGCHNSAAAFVRTKLNPVAGSAPDDWTIRAHRAEVILPRHADDSLADPRTLFNAIDTEHPDRGAALLAYITLTWQPERLHLQWAVGRQLAIELADAHDVALLLVQHVPGQAGRGNDPHLHLAIAGPRRIKRWSGFGSYVTPLMGDRMWAMIRSKFHALLAPADKPGS